MKKKLINLGIPLFLLIVCSVVFYKLNISDTTSLGIQEKDQLQILTWEGYADVKYVKEFEKTYNVNVIVTYVQNDDELWDKLVSSKEKKFDVVAANTAEISRYIDANLIQPIDVIKITNIKNQTDQFRNYRNLEQIVLDEKIYAVPYAYAEMGLIYNKKIMKTIPESMAILWDPKYKGKVLAFNTYQHNFTFAAMAMGYKDPFNLSKEQLKVVTKKLIELKKNSLGIYNTLEEANKIFRDYDIALVFANFGRQQLNELKKIGADVGYVIPKESALAWLDCWAIPAHSQNKDLAEKWINFTLSRDVSANLTLTHGLSNTIRENFNQDDKEKLTWLRPINEPALRKRIWDEILKGKTDIKL